MKISQQLKQQQHLSIEVFPPKGELKIESLHDILNGMKELKPDFISVTCSAGGSGNSANTAEMAGIIKNDYNIESCAHFTCINSDINSVQTQIAELKQRGIENVLALRGDLVDGKQPRDFHYAKDIIPLLRNEGFCVGAACYPEGHIECVDLDRDIRFLREKQDVGAEFFLFRIPRFSAFRNRNLRRRAEHFQNHLVDSRLLQTQMRFHCFPTQFGEKRFHRQTHFQTPRIVFLPLLQQLLIHRRCRMPPEQECWFRCRPQMCRQWSLEFQKAFAPQ